VVFNQGNPSGSTTLAGASYLGCDSTVNVSLSFYQPSVYNLSQQLCTASSLTVNGTVYNAANPSGTQVITGGSYLGCDSTINVNLTFGNEVVVTLNPILCPGEFIYINGTLYYIGNTSGSETFAGGSYLGCDSTVNVSLSFYPEAVGYLDTIIPSGKTIVVNGTTYSQSHPSGVEVFVDGSYTGCDSTLFVTVGFLGTLKVELELTSPTCFGDNDGSIEITGITGGAAPYVIALNGANSMIVDAFPVVYGNLDAGFHQLTVQDNAGVLMVQEVTIPSPPKLVVELGEDIPVNLGESITLSAEATFVIDSWEWLPGTYLDCTTCPSPTVISPADDITYTLLVTDIDGCTAQDEVTILVQKVRQVYVPSVFSPNNDGINDELIVFGSPQVAKVNVFKVFNRWGDLLFESYNFQPNDPLYGWDGRFQGERMNTGVYVWFAEVEFVDGHREVFEGGATLLR
jgi:gliding motility-associated-like protein